MQSKSISARHAGKTLRGKGCTCDEIKCFAITQKILKWTLPEGSDFRRRRPSQHEQLDERSGTRKGRGVQKRCQQALQKLLILVAMQMAMRLSLKTAT
jgi:hypothetical protein